MAKIMCTQKLWRALGERGLPPVTVVEPELPGAMLGSWAVKLLHRDRRGLVIALNSRTYLTLVFPLAPSAQLRARFTQALTWALQDLGVPASTSDREASIIDVLPFARLNDRHMTGSLNDLEFLCQVELDYTDDLRRVQRNLNDVPHAKREPAVPAEAIARLFARPWLRQTELYTVH